MTPTETALDLIYEHFGIDPYGITDATTLADVGIDSLGRMEMVMAIEDRIGAEISDADTEALATIGDVIRLIGKVSK